MGNEGNLRGHILVVDDNKINLMMLNRALTSQGYQVSTARDGGQALEILFSEQGQTIDVILLDILMPDLDGYQLLEKVKGDEALRHIPVIMISALDEMDSVIRCIEMGATDYLHKPYNPALLQARLNASLVEKRLRDLELEYLEQVSHVVGAAESVESSTYDPDSLAGVATRDDALGNLARVFQRMANEVHLREQRLKQQLEQLRIDIEDMKKSMAEPLSVYIPMDRRQALVHGLTLPEKSAGSAIFADISGFTPLSEALAGELGRKRGAEELTRILNRVYGALIEEVHRYRGSVVGFSGDAITCYLDGDDGLNAAGCALAMQAVIRQLSSITTPSGNQFTLGIKVAVVSGPVRRFLVGDPRIQNIEILAGKPVELMATAEHLAKKGEVIVQGEIVDRYPEFFSREDNRVDDISGETFAVVSPRSEIPLPQPWIELRKDVLTADQCRPWLLPSVYELVTGEAKAYLSEFRRAAAIFLSFAGINYEEDAEAGEKLDKFIRWVQSVVEQYGGSVLQLTIGDKGSYLYAVFGAPIAHNDDAVRAVYAALTLKEVPVEFGWIENIQIGITQGQMRTGSYGSPARRTYGAQGDIVNLAARLMQSAQAGILCDESIFQATQARLVFESLPPIKVKGVQGPVSIYRPTGEKKRLSRKQVELIGRNPERILLAESIRDIRHGSSKVVLIEGEAGIGKSRLVYLMQEFARGSGVKVCMSDGSSRDKKVPLQPWSEIFWQLYDLESFPNLDSKRERLLKALNGDGDSPASEAVATAIMAAKLNGGENSDGAVVIKEHKELLLGLLENGINESPTVIVIEDSQSLDPDSWDLIQAASMQVKKLLICLAARPLTEPSPPGYAHLLRSPLLKTLHLKGISPEEAYLLACRHLEAVSLPRDIVDILGKAGGNPQFVEEMVYILRDDGYIQVRDGECIVTPGVDLRAIAFPTTADGLIKSRIDRLSPSEQLTLKVASVVGRTYSLRALQAIYPLEADKPFLERYLDTLAKLDLILPTGRDSNYNFRDEITYESVYNSMLFSQRRQLHRKFAEWIEQENGNDLSPHYANLAYHWRNADDTAKAIDYLEKAGQNALEAGDYELAERYFRECLDLDATAAVLSTEFFEKKLKRESA
ncbi:MAG: response regulator [Chloroflexota bacterium]|nr:MAG: response regulator [Chloroflexota bacterium]